MSDRLAQPITRRQALSITVGAALVAAAGCSDTDEPPGGASGADAGSVPDTDPTTSEASTDGATSSTTPAGTGVDGSATTSTAGSGAERSALTAADFDGVGACTLTPEQTSGPFYLRADLVRRDITEDRIGSPVRVGLRVEDADCRPVEQARVDIWHADLDGDYSAFIDRSADDEEGEGTTFLRGTQMTDADGIVEFDSIFPGWYPDRALHIHVMVYEGRNRVLTSQMYFSEAVIADVYRSAPYAERGLPDMPTSRDSIAGDTVAQGLEMSVTGDDAGRLALLRLHVPA